MHSSNRVDLTCSRSCRLVLWRPRWSLVQAILGTLLGQPEVTWSLVPLLVATQFIYAALLALLIIPAIGVMYRGAGDEGRFA